MTGFVNNSKTTTKDVGDTSCDASFVYIGNATIFCSSTVEHIKQCRENFPTVFRNHTDVINHPLLPCFQANRLDLEDGPHYEIIKQTTFKVHDKLIKSRKNTRNNVIRQCNGSLVPRPHNVIFLVSSLRSDTISASHQAMILLILLLI